jgi:hypothetical protein
MSTSKIDSIPKWNECMTPRTYKTPRTFRIIFAVFSTIETPRKISTLLSSNLKKKKYVKKFLHHILKRGKKKRLASKRTIVDARKIPVQLQADFWPVNPLEQGLV